MDLASLVGVLGAFGIVIFAMILGGDIDMRCDGLAFALGLHGRYI